MADKDTPTTGHQGKPPEARAPIGNNAGRGGNPTAREPIAAVTTEESFRAYTAPQAFNLVPGIGTAFTDEEKKSGVTIRRANDGTIAGYTFYTNKSGVIMPSEFATPLRQNSKGFFLINGNPVNQETAFSALNNAVPQKLIILAEGTAFTDAEKKGIATLRLDEDGNVVGYILKDSDGNETRTKFQTNVKVDEAGKITVDDKPATAQAALDHIHKIDLSKVHVNKWEGTGYPEPRAMSLKEAMALPAWQKAAKVIGDYYYPGFNKPFISQGPAEDALYFVRDQATLTGSSFNWAVDKITGEAPANVKLAKDFLIQQYDKVNSLMTPGGTVHRGAMLAGETFIGLRAFAAVRAALATKIITLSGGAAGGIMGTGGTAATVAATTSAGAATVGAETLANATKAAAPEAAQTAASLSTRQIVSATLRGTGAALKEGFKETPRMIMENMPQTVAETAIKQAGTNESIVLEDGRIFREQRDFSLFNLGTESALNATLGAAGFGIGGKVVGAGLRGVFSKEARALATPFARNFGDGFARLATNFYGDANLVARYNLQSARNAFTAIDSYLFAPEGVQTGLVSPVSFLGTGAILRGIRATSNFVATSRITNNMVTNNPLTRGVTGTVLFPVKATIGVTRFGVNVAREAVEAATYQAPPGYKWADTKLPWPGFVNNAWSYFYHGPAGHRVFGINVPAGRIIPTYERPGWQGFIDSLPDSWPFKTKRDLLRNMEFSFYTAGRLYLRPAIKEMDNALVQHIDPLVSGTNSFNDRLATACTEIADELAAGRINEATAKSQLRSVLQAYAVELRDQPRNFRGRIDRIINELYDVKADENDYLTARRTLRPSHIYTFENQAILASNRVETLVAEANTRASGFFSLGTNLLNPSTPSANLQTGLRALANDAKQAADDLAKMARPAIEITKTGDIVHPLSVMQQADMRLNGIIPDELNGMIGSDDVAWKEIIRDLEREMTGFYHNPNTRILPIDRFEVNPENSERSFIEIQNMWQEIQTKKAQGTPADPAVFLAEKLWSIYKINRESEGIFGLWRLGMRQGKGRGDGADAIPSGTAMALKNLYTGARDASGDPVDPHFMEYVRSVDRTVNLIRQRHSADPGGQRAADKLWFDLTNSLYIATRTPQHTRIAKVYAIDNYRIPRNNFFVNWRAGVFGARTVPEKPGSLEKVIDWGNYRFFGRQAAPSADDLKTKGFFGGLMARSFGRTPGWLALASGGLLTPRGLAVYGLTGAAGAGAIGTYNAVADGIGYVTGSDSKPYKIENSLSNNPAWKLFKVNTIPAQAILWDGGDGGLVYGAGKGLLADGGVAWFDGWWNKDRSFWNPAAVKPAAIGAGKGAWFGLVNGAGTAVNETFISGYNTVLGGRDLLFFGPTLPPSPQIPRFGNQIRLPSFNSLFDGTTSPTTPDPDPDATTPAAKPGGSGVGGAVDEIGMALPEQGGNPLFPAESAPAMQTAFNLARMVPLFPVAPLAPLGNAAADDDKKASTPDEKLLEFKQNMQASADIGSTDPLDPGPQNKSGVENRI